MILMNDSMWRVWPVWPPPLCRHLLPHTQTFWSEHNEVSWTGCEVLIVYFHLLRWGMTSARLRSSTLCFPPAWLFRTKPEKVATNPCAYVSRMENLSSRPQPIVRPQKRVRVSVDREAAGPQLTSGGQWSFTRLSAAGQRHVRHLESQANVVIFFFFKTLLIWRQSDATIWI